MYFRLYASILLLSTPPWSNCNLQPVPDYHNKSTRANYQLGKIVASFVNTFLTENTKEIDILTFYETESQKRFQADFLTVVLLHLEIIFTVSLSSSWEPRRSVLILADSHASLRNAMLSSRNNDDDFKGYFLVYLTQSISSEDLSMLLKYFFERNIINISIIVPHWRTGDLVIITYFPFSRWRCFDYRPIEICTYLDGDFVSFTGNSCKPYPRKLNNFYGCELIVNVYESPPYLYLKTDPQGKTSLSGLEGEILNIIARKLNFKISILVPIITAMDDRITEFISGPGNISIGRLRATTIRRRNVSSSVDYHKNELVLVTRSERSLSSLERLVIPASSRIWLSYFFILVAAYIVVLMVDRRFLAVRQFVVGTGNRDPTYWIWVTALGGPVIYKPRRNFARYILMQWIVFNFFLRSGYQTFFYKSLRLDYKVGLPNNIDELLANGYIISSTADTRRCFWEGSLERIIDVYNGTDVEALQELELSGAKNALVVPDEFFSYYQRMNVNNRLSRIKEPLVEHMLTMHLRRNSYLKLPLDSYLLQMRVSGFLTHFRKTFMPRSDTKSLTTVPNSVKLADIFGYFQVYAYSVFNSFIGLGIEFASLKVKSLQRLFL